MSDSSLRETVEQFTKNYDVEEIYFSSRGRHFPNRATVIELLEDIRRLMFPRYFRDEVATGDDPEYFIGNMLMKIRNKLSEQLREAFSFRNEKQGLSCDVEDDVKRVCDEFIARLPELQRLLLKDVQAAFDGDPAAQSKEEIIFSYPGFFAIFVYRVAHELYVRDVPLIPRIMTEHAHGQTGVDINSGADIGEYFFIDHATGVVIGETTTIGAHVKIYQGVTLGALSTRGGQRLSGVKRHPTIEDNVTIYSNASVLGGETVIGEGSVIGGSAFITESVPPNSRVSGLTHGSATEERRPHWNEESVQDGAGI